MHFQCSWRSTHVVLFNWAAEKATLQGVCNLAKATQVAQAHGVESAVFRSPLTPWPCS